MEPIYLLAPKLTSQVAVISHRPPCIEQVGSFVCLSAAARKFSTALTIGSARTVIAIRYHAYAIFLVRAFIGLLLV